VRIEAVDARLGDAVGVGSSVPVAVQLAVGDIPFEEVVVEGYFGVLDNQGIIRGGETVTLQHEADLGHGQHRFSGTLECRFCGRYGFLVRAMPRHPQVGPVYEPGYLVWG